LCHIQIAVCVPKRSALQKAQSTASLAKAAPHARRHRPTTMDNDAFRTIMATPRPHQAGGGGEKFDKKSLRKLVDADLQRSKAGSKKHKGAKASTKKDPLDPEAKKEKKEKKPSKYRDRTKERNTDTNADYKTDDAAAALEVDAEASKYLGGDVAHTHLVRGLDRSLLEKTRKDQFEAMPPPPSIAHVVKRSIVPESPLARAALACFKSPQRSATAHRRVRVESRAYDLTGMRDPALYDAPPTTIVRSAADRSQLFDDETPAPRVDAAVVHAAVTALGRKGSKMRKKAAAAPVVATTAVPLPPGDDEDIFAGAGRYVETDGPSLAERAAASRRAAAAADDEDGGDAAAAAQYLPPPKAKPPPSKAESDDEFEEAARGASPEAAIPAAAPTKPQGNRKERRKTKQLVHRDPIMKKKALSWNFDGSSDAYGEATMYDSDDETYAMKKQREAAADAEAAHYRQKGKKRRKKGGSDDEE